MSALDPLGCSYTVIALPEYTLDIVFAFDPRGARLLLALPK